MRFLSSLRIVRVTLALAVAFWMAGAGCLLGCENMVSAAAHAGEVTPGTSAATTANTANIVVAADACASMHAHDCCARRKTPSVAKSHTGSGNTPTVKPADKPQANQPGREAMLTTADHGATVAELIAPVSTMMDCPLAVNATAALSKARPDESGGELLTARTVGSFSYFKEQLTALTPPSLLPNRGHTYLRCCVFLI
jgi:hypothetical protein